MRERESLFNKLNVKLQVCDFVISPHPHQQPKINLNPKIDDEGLLRAEGRLSLFSVDDFSCEPIILDAKEDVNKRLSRKIFSWESRQYYK